jgi:hypothetical protein
MILESKLQTTMEGIVIQSREGRIFLTGKCHCIILEGNQAYKCNLMNYIY